MTHFDMDVQKLGHYLEGAIRPFEGLKNISKFDGGQSNPTFRLHAQSGDYVLRRKPPGILLPSAHAVDREYRVLQALAATDVPVAKVFHLCTDEEIIGSMFYIMEFVDADIYWDPAMPQVDMATRTAIYDAMNHTLAAIHNVDIQVAGLSDYGKPGNYFARQFGRWTKQYRGTQTRQIDAMETLIDWLDHNMVADDGRVALVHGDYRLDNMLVARGGSDIRAVVDWELSTLGHPFSDLAYQCMQWRMPAHGTVRGLEGLDREALGIPCEDAYIAAYCARTGIDEIPHWEFYLAFSFFRLASIVQGVMKRAIDGNASSTRAREVGRLTEPLAQKALQVING